MYNTFMPPIDALLQLNISFYLLSVILLLSAMLLYFGVYWLRSYIKKYGEMESILREYKEKDVQVFVGMNQELKSKIQQLQGENEALKAEIKRLLVKNTELEAEIQQLQGVHEALKADIQILLEKNKAREADIQQLRAKNEALEADHEHLQAKREIEAEPREFSDKEAYQNFMYRISHEISNPLQRIQTSLDNMAGLTPGEKDQWEQNRSIMTDEIRRLRGLTTSLRQLSRLETTGAVVERELVNIRGVIESVILELDEQAAEKGVKLKMQCPPHPARVMANRDQIRQVLINLVDNGIKYGPEKDGEVLIDVQDDGKRLCVRVFDNGIGIPEADLPHIFDIGYRSPGAVLKERKGSGLSLTIVKRIITQHGGNIRVESKPGHGTAISFDLPVSR